MDLNTGRLGKEAMTRGAAMGEASLASLPGKGTLQVWRGQRQDVLEIRGTWRPADELDHDELKQRLETSEPVVYEGTLDDPAQSEHSNVRAEVLISSMASYHLGDGQDSARLYVNFVPAQPEQVAS